MTSKENMISDILAFCVKHESEKTFEKNLKKIIIETLEDNEDLSEEEIYEVCTDALEDLIFTSPFSRAIFMYKNMDKIYYPKSKNIDIFIEKFMQDLKYQISLDKMTNYLNILGTEQIRVFHNWTVNKCDIFKRYEINF